METTKTINIGTTQLQIRTTVVSNVMKELKTQGSWGTIAKLLCYLFSYRSDWRIGEIAMIVSLYYPDSAYKDRPQQRVVYDARKYNKGDFGVPPVHQVRIIDSKAVGRQERNPEDVQAAFDAIMNDE